MAGKLVFDTLQDGSANTVPVTTVIKGSAKAWVRYAGATGVVAGSFNVSSVTRTAAGDHTINFTAPMADLNYAMAASIAQANSTALAGTYESTTTARLTTAIRVWTAPNTGTGTDSTIHTLSFFGN